MYTMIQVIKEADHTLVFADEGFPPITALPIFLKE